MKTKISTLLEYRKSIQTPQFAILVKLLTDRSNSIIQYSNILWPTLTTDEGEYSNNMIGLQRTHENLLKFASDFTGYISGLNNEIDSLIDSLGKEYMHQDNLRYREHCDTVDYIFTRLKKYPITFNEDASLVLNARIQLYNHWKYPGVQFRPGLGNLTEKLVALDPLYLVDEDKVLFREVEKKFTPLYQQRLRYKIVNEESPDMFDNFPHQQIGFVFISDFFEYKPLNTINIYLENVYNKLLKKGGTVMFTYNNCDFINATINAENTLHAYTPGRVIRKMAIEIGFEIVFEYTSNEVSWLELQKPGKLTSIKGGQCIARIHKKEIS